eukprot:308551-Amorphochlora_amoeboformis.AAC.3
MGATCQRLSTEGLPRIRRRLDANEDVNSSFVDRPAGLYAGPPPSQATMKDDDTKDGSRPAGSPSARSGMGDLTADDLLRLLADTKVLGGRGYLWGGIVWREKSYSFVLKRTERW